MNEVEKIYQEYHEELACIQEYIRENPEYARYEEIMVELADKELNERLASARM